MTDDPNRDRSEDPAAPVILPEPPPEVADPPPPQARRNRRGLLLGTLAVLLALGSGLYGYRQGWFATTPAPDAALAAVAALETRLAALEAAAPQDARVPALSDQITALAPLPDRIAALDARLAQLETDLAALAAVPADGSVSAATVAALAAEVAALKAQGPGAASPDDLRALVQDELSAWEAAAAERLAQQQAQAQAAAAATAAGAALRQAITSGAPYADALAALPGPHPDVLTRNAATGLPTLASLQAAFPDAARLALEASLRATAGNGMADRLWTFLRLQTGARSTEARAGTDPDAVLSRAEAALAQGRLADATAELQALPPEGLTAMADWLALVDLHLAAQAALDAL